MNAFMNNSVYEALKAGVFCWRDSLYLAWTLCFVTLKIVYIHK